MLLNYVKVAVRNLINSRVYSLVNIAGLAVGLAASILILLFVRSEVGYDRQWRDAERIHRLNVTFSYRTWSREKNIIKQVYDAFRTP